MATQPTTVADGQSEDGEHALDFLLSRRGVRVPHSGGTLLDHLTAVRDKLEAWGCRPALCTAGLYHSIYGTDNFRQQTVALTERPAVREVIGEEAEALAYAFCMLNTRAFLTEVEADLESAIGNLQDSDRITAATKLDLLHMFVANWLEQFPRMRAIQRSMHTILFRRIKPILLPLAAEEIDRTFGFESRPARRLTVLPVAADVKEAGEISVLDDFVPQHLRDSLAALTERNIWRYGWKASSTQTAHHFWHCHFAGDNGDEDASCEAELEDRALTAPILALWHHIRDNLTPGHVPVRVYANGHTFGADGHVHTDSERPGHFTSIYYAHPQWKPNWGGETVFLDSTGEDVVRAIYPLPGRLVHFPGNILHAARSPSRDCGALRAVIVIKTFCPTAR